MHRFALLVALIVTAGRQAKGRHIRTSRLLLNTSSTVVLRTCAP